MASHSSILAWKTPWTEEPGAIAYKVTKSWTQLHQMSVHTYTHTHTHTHTHGTMVGLVTKLCLTLVNPWTVACQVPLSMGFSRQESWSGLPFPSPGDLPDLRIKLGSPTLQADSQLTELWVKPMKNNLKNYWYITESFFCAPVTNTIL